MDNRRKAASRGKQPIGRGGRRISDVGGRYIGLVIEAAPNAMVMVDGKGRIVLVNRQLEKMFGHSRETLLGQSIEVLVPAHYRAAHAVERGAFFAHPSVRSMGAGRDLYGLRADGTEVPIEIGLNPVPTPEGTFVLASIIDISERKRMTAQAQQTREQALRRSILDCVPFSIIAIDPAGIIMSANPAAERLLGYASRELLGKPAMALLHDPVEIEARAAELTHGLRGPVPAGVQALIGKAASGGIEEREWSYLRKDGSVLPVNIAVAALRDENGAVTGYLEVAYDIVERKRAEAYIRHLAQHDALTGLPNRMLLIDRIDMAIRQARKNRTLAGVLMIDLDHFKHVNDTLGHAAGDELLLNVSRSIQSCVRETDTVSRLGGDEFVILVGDVETRAALEKMADTVMHRISTPMVVQGTEVMVTPSIGGSVFPDDGADTNTLLKHADTAMYHAKSEGRSTMRWFDTGLLRYTEEKLALTGALKSALERGELELRYQPIVSMRDRRIIGKEALIRWRHPRLGMIGPERFIPLAEETGLIVPIGDWVLRTALRDSVRFRAASQQPLFMAVNVSPRQFQQKDWIDTVRAALAESGLPASSLHLEVTEGLMMRNPEQSAELMRAIRQLGASMVIDDFGTGYSSLSYITRFPVDKIKIDRSFVRDLASDAADAAIVDAIIAMAHSLKLRTVAEGVECSHQVDYLVRRGCDEAQGFHFGEPLTAEEFLALFKRGEEQAAPA